MEKDCIRLTSEEKERLIEFKKSDEFLKAYKLIKEEIGLKERKKLYFHLKVLFCLSKFLKKEIQGRYLEALEGERKQAVYFSISESLFVPGAIYTENAGCMDSRKNSTQS